MESYRPNSILQTYYLTTGLEEIVESRVAKFCSQDVIRSRKPDYRRRILNVNMSRGGCKF